MFIAAERSRGGVSLQYIAIGLSEVKLIASVPECLFPESTLISSASGSSCYHCSMRDCPVWCCSYHYHFASIEEVCGSCFRNLSCTAGKM